MFFYKKLIVIVRRKLSQTWNRESGEWRWLNDQPVKIASLNKSLWRVSIPSANFFVLLGLSGVIATLGLLADSAATIIGAMIVAPLMGPILGIAYSMVVANRRLLKRSSLTLASGVLLTISTSAIITEFIGLRGLTDEITSRTSPSLIDLGIAVAAGAAGAFAKSRRGVADALPGVAIAVALVPPLSVVGIGIAFRSEQVTYGSLLLFLTNLLGIIFSGGIVFLCLRYGTLARAKRGLLFSVIALAVLGLPLGYQMQTLLTRANVRRSVELLVTRRTLTFSDTDLRFVSVRRRGSILVVELEVATLPDTVTSNQVALVRDFLSGELGTEVDLTVRIVPIQTLEAPAPIEAQEVL